MFSVPHLIIIFAVALMVFGPEKLPELARNLGKIMGEFRRATGELRSTFEGHMRDLEREAELRRVREAQAPAAQQTDGGTAASSPGTPSLPAESTSDPLPPAPGTVATQAPTAFTAHELRSTEQPEPIAESSAMAEAHDSSPVDHPDAENEKVSDGRPRPA
jgi:sec-independent protein translocase protein TatB